MKNDSTQLLERPRGFSLFCKLALFYFCIAGKLLLFLNS